MAVPTALSMGGKGCDFQIAVSSTAVNATTSIGGVKSIKGPGIKVGTRDVTTLLSTWKEVAATIPDAGPITLSIMYDNTSSTLGAIQAALASQTLNGCKLIFPTTTRFMTFLAVITGYDVSGIEVEGTVMVDLGLQITGPIAFPVTT